MELYDTKDVPTKKYGDGIQYDWKHSINHKIGVRNNNSYIYYNIIGYDTKTGNISLESENKSGEIHIINRYIFKSNRKDVAANKISREHLFKHGEKIHGYIILEQIRLPHHRVKNCTIKGYNVKCLNCGNVLNVSENNLIRKNDGFCIYCSPKCKKGINDMWTTNPEIANLLKNPNDGYNYTIKFSSKKLEWVCPSCGEIILSSPNQVFHHGLTCRKCSDKISMPEKIMYNILSALNINFESQKILENKSFIINSKEYIPRYDFYFEINGDKYIIEMDGGFHNKTHSHSERSIEEIKIIDNKKDELAKINNCTIIRICADPSKFDFVYDNILKNDILNNLFDFSSLNRNDIFINCMKSLMKEICDYYNNTTNDMHKIAKHFHVTYNYVYNSLRIGAQLKLSNYVPENQGNLMRKPLKIHSVVCNELSLIFKTPKILSEQSEHYFGFKIKADDIYAYFSKKRGDINGYSFKYIPYEQCEEIEKILPNIVVV